MPNTLPIIIDDIKQYEDFKMTRCNYFSVECDNPSLGWSLIMDENRRLPFVMIGLQGIIFNSINDSGIFKSAQDLDKLFELIEESDKNFYIDINDIWLPNFLFPKRFHVIANTLRIGIDLFKIAYDFRLQRITINQFLNESRELRDQVFYEYVELETSAFKEWEKNQIEEARNNYHANEEQTLKYRDE